MLFFVCSFCFKEDTLTIIQDILIINLPFSRAPNFSKVSRGGHLTHQQVDGGSADQLLQCRICTDSSRPQTHMWLPWHLQFNDTLSQV